MIQLLLLLVIGYINSSDMDRLKYLCNYSHDLISSTGTIPHIPPRLPKLSKTEKPCMPRKLNRREILSKKKKRRKKEKKNLHRHRSHHFTFLNVTNYCIFSSAHNQPPLELESISPPSLPPPLYPSPPLCIPYTIHTHEQLRIFDRNLSVRRWFSSASTRQPSFRALRETKGVDCERGTKNPGHPFEKRNKQGRKERESVTRIEEQTGGPARINQISALSVRKSDSCGAGSSSTRGGNEFVRNPRSKHSILRGDYIRGRREKKEEYFVDEGSTRSYGDEDLSQVVFGILDFILIRMDSCIFHFWKYIECYGFLKYFDEIGIIGDYKFDEKLNNHVQLLLILYC